MRKQQQKLTLAYQQGHPILWCKYCHSARLLLLGTGDIGLWLQVDSITSFTVPARAHAVKQVNCTLEVPFFHYRGDHKYSQEIKQCQSLLTGHKNNVNCCAYPTAVKNSRFFTGKLASSDVVEQTSD